MPENERLQLLGPLCLIAAFVGAALSAHALGTWPASPFLWYANLEVFRLFRETPDALGGISWLSALGLAPPMAMAMVLTALIGFGVMTKHRLPLAIASNFSVIYSVCLLYGSFISSDPVVTGGARLAALLSLSNALAMAVLLVSILSSTISHRSYWREIFS